MFCSTFTLPTPFTLAALSHGLAASLGYRCGNVSVFWAKLMSMHTVRLQRFKPSRNVFPVSYGLQMDGVRALTNTAEMVRDKSVEWANESSVGKIRGGRELAIIAKSSVAVTIATRRPKPAWNTLVRYVRVYANLGKEARENLGIYRKPVRIILHGLVSFRDRLCLGLSGAQYREALSF